MHDYFEIICMRLSHVTVTLDDGKQHSGIAQNIVKLDNNEHLVLLENNKILNIPLNKTETLEANNNPIPKHNFKVIFN
ncbi:hypothetical protein XM47_00515 [Catenovulum maritimum]|uniref:Rho-binding antiterminator n=2 Tax=Catenovulum maritimum TaxID=1513271 RepID=A0A0J8GW37_9ALTE|nr:hypothetical protein XM47_00515 [Catenovulum maritimum]